MTWINRFSFYFGITAILTGGSITVRDSYNTLLGSQAPIHATPHITNLIRNGAQELSTNEKMDLAGLGLAVLGKNIVALAPVDLDQSYDTEHFRLFYTLDGYDSVENLEYVIQVGQVFEQVWTFYMDTLEFEPPPSDPDADHDLYDVYLENLFVFRK